MWWDSETGPSDVLIFRFYFFKNVSLNKEFYMNRKEQNTGHKFNFSSSRLDIKVK